MGLVVAAIAVLLISGWIGGAIGAGKGRAGAGFALGLLFGIFGWIAVGLMSPTAKVRQTRAQEIATAVAGQHEVAATPTRPCPWCAEQIQSAAVVCRFCGRQVDPQVVPRRHAQLPQLRASWRGEVPDPLLPLRTDKLVRRLSALRAKPSPSTLRAFVQTVDDCARATGKVPLGAVKGGLLGAALLAGVPERDARTAIDKVCATKVAVPYEAWLPGSG